MPLPSANVILLLPTAFGSYHISAKSRPIDEYSS